TKPPGNGPFPALLYNHGSEPDPKRFATLRDWFVGHGYVFFLPHRRGQGLSPGPYIVDQMKHARDKQHAPAHFLEEQFPDVANAAAFLRTQPFVDPARMAVGGCSFGGIQTLLAAERGLGMRAAIDWAGDAESWHNGPLRQRLLAAVDHAKVPIFFLQAQNDYSTEPTRVFSAEAARAKKPHKAKLFPAYGDPTSHAMGHGGFCVHGTNVWGPDVLQFLEQHLK
ncbi:MAG TPA: prolyl oligopeptidase family serine peptidase, partial [Minicystis sp.]|nr:prolyl oligopeptidase family serine peptidase [Minicystis sp.]